MTNTSSLSQLYSVQCHVRFSFTHFELFPEAGLVCIRLMQLFYTIVDHGRIDPGRVVWLLQVNNAPCPLHHCVVFVMFDELRQGIEFLAAANIVLVIILSRKSAL